MFISVHKTNNCITVDFPYNDKNLIILWHTNDNYEIYINENNINELIDGGSSLDSLISDLDLIDDLTNHCKKFIIKTIGEF